MPLLHDGRYRIVKVMLLSRNEFREAVFSRDSLSCIMCDKEATAAHHIIERKLFSDGGYYIDNGASLCNECHWKAEQTIISCDSIRNEAKIKNIILPEGFDTNLKYDKWCNVIINDNVRMPGVLFHEKSVQNILRESNLLRLFY